MKVRNLITKNKNTFKGPFIIEPQIFRDDRGLFFESWNQDKFNDFFPNKIHFLQDNHSYSKKDVLRGLHYQLAPYPQAKLVRCTFGSIFDVIVDIRSDSETYGEWASVELNGNNNKQIWIPEGFAHGFLVLSDSAIVQYKTTNLWVKNLERTIRWDDNTIGIAWPIHNAQKLHLSDKDNNGQSLTNARIKKEIF